MSTVFKKILSTTGEKVATGKTKLLISGLLISRLVRYERLYGNS
nr:MAG TPA: hypothetical protein [Caudoviricetes sp.]